MPDVNVLLVLLIPHLTSIIMYKLNHC